MCIQSALFPVHHGEGRSVASLNRRCRDALRGALIPLAKRSVVREHVQSVQDAIPVIRDLLECDVAAALEGDPAATSRDEVILCYPGLFALSIHRIAHHLARRGVPLVPRMMAEHAHRETGIDIHPNASIGARFFIDHGTGVVIGESSIIGIGCTLYQGVTLGALRFDHDLEGRLVRGGQRHPTLEDNVTVYANATILGGNTVIGAGSVVGADVFLSKSVPAGSVIVGAVHTQARSRAARAALRTES